jgi:hypothetical protein
MFRKAIFSAAAVLVAASLLWAANDPWKSKPYQQWDEKDVRRIFNDSPWAKVVQVSGPPSADQGGMPSSSNSSAIPQNRSMGGGTGQYSQPSMDIQSQQSSQSSATPFVVRWVSSRAIREAAVRSAELKGQLKPDDDVKDLAQAMDTYQVLVTGPNMKPFLAVDENTLRNSTFLELKGTKERLAPSSVKIERTTDGATIESVVFSFPKKSESGEPTIPPGGKGAEFSTSAGGTRINTSFDFSKMEDTQGLDL